MRHYVFTSCYSSLAALLVRIANAVCAITLAWRVGTIFSPCSSAFDLPPACHRWI